MKGADGAKLQTFSLAFIAMFGVGVLLHMTQSFMVPFVIAVLLAYLLIPASIYLTRLKIHPVIANTLVMLGFCVVLICLVFVIYGALSAIASTLPKYLSKYDAFLDHLSARIRTHIDIDIANEYKNLRIEQIFGIISPSAVMKTVNRSLGAFIAFVSRLTLMMIFLIFIISSRNIFINKIFAFFHAKKGEDDETVMVIQKIAKQIQTYLLLKTVISIFTGAVFGLAAYMFGLDFAFMWGFLAVLFNFIPTLGPIIASVPPIFLSLLQFDSLLWAILTSFCLSAVQFSSGSFVEPMIMGDRLNLNIIAILLSLLLWGLIWGVPGMFLAVPITGALNIVVYNIPSLRNFSILLSK